MIPARDTVIVHQLDTQQIFKCVRELIDKEGCNFRQALIYIYVCKFALFSLNEYCRESGWTANFLSDKNLVNVLSKIIDAHVGE